VFEVPIIAWIAAAVLAAIVLAFCGYELWWKARRLQDDLTRLQALNERVAELQSDIAEAQARIAAATSAATD
jgi:outer membrane murein-binding lipoprotein Lpp